MPPTTINLGTRLDLAVVVIYFLAILGFGAFFGRYTKTTKDFFLAGQKFSWWLIATSCVASLVGSYSFVKYSEMSFKHGFSGTYGYLNDWFWMPFWILGWLPIIYFTRTTSVPEYFERRFGRDARAAATVIILLYMIGYISINLVTMATALDPLLGWGKFNLAVIVAVICAIYVTAGGQTSVIMTDLAQGFLLLIAGVAILFLGVAYVGGWQSFWNALPGSFKHALPNFAADPNFSTAGVFWQDGMANSAAFWFMNQGIILRFLSAKSVEDGRKAATATLLVLMPLAAIAVCDAGWIGRAMVNLNLGQIPADVDPRQIFVVVTERICRPGVFGLVLAALTAALMSTIDTLINAVSAVTVNDLYRPYLARNRSDRHYLAAARWISLAAAGLGVALYPVFNQKSLYVAHGAFTAAITPPMVVAIVLGMAWRRYNRWGVLATLIGGALAIFASFARPGLLSPFRIGAVGDEYIRAYYGLVVCLVLGVAASLLSRRPEPQRLAGYVWGPQRALMRMFKGSEPNLAKGEVAACTTQLDEQLAEGTVRAPASAMRTMQARPGDLVLVSRPGWWHGGVLAAHARLGEPLPDGEPMRIPRDVLAQLSIPEGRTAHVEKIF